MNDVEDMLKRQAEWQQSRKALPWPEKLRMAAAVRESILLLRGAGKRPEPSDSKSDPQARR